VAIADGDHEEMIFRTHTEQLTRQIPGAQLILLRDVSHFAPFQDPAQFNEAVHNFLEAPERHRARHERGLFEARPRDAVGLAVACGYFSDALCNEPSNTDSCLARRWYPGSRDVDGTDLLVRLP
jgi:hypothetical protein